MITKLLKEIERLTETERGLAAEQYGPTFHSTHEAYAVILEETQEARMEVIHATKNLDEFWQCVKRDDTEEITNLLLAIKKHAQQAAAECIQVAAMCEKAMQPQKKG